MYFKGDSGSGLVEYLDKNEERAVLIAIHITEGMANRVMRHLDWIYNCVNDTNKC